MGLPWASARKNFGFPPTKLTASSIGSWTSLFSGGSLPWQLRPRCRDHRQQVTINDIENGPLTGRRENHSHRLTRCPLPFSLMLDIMESFAGCASRQPHCRATIKCFIASMALVEVSTLTANGRCPVAPKSRQIRHIFPIHSQESADAHCYVDSSMSRASASSMFSVPRPVPGDIIMSARAPLPDTQHQ